MELRGQAFPAAHPGKAEENVGACCAHIMCVCVYVCVCVCARARVLICTYMYMYVCMYVYMYKWRKSALTQAHTHMKYHTSYAHMQKFQPVRKLTITACPLSLSLSHTHIHEISYVMRANAKKNSAHASVN
jgi:hypothetical protein